MSQEDRQRWNQKWSERAGKLFTPHPVLTAKRALLTGGMALDIACGIGQNAIWLAGQGYQVIGVDISEVALRSALTNAKKLEAMNSIVFTQMDLESWSLPANVLDLICVFRFLNRDLFPGIRAGLKPGGLLFYATRHTGALSSYPEANRAYLLQPGELFKEFSDWEILHCEENLENSEIIARKGDGNGCH